MKQLALALICLALGLLSGCASIPHESYCASMSPDGKTTIVRFDPISRRFTGIPFAIDAEGLIPVDLVQIGINPCQLH